MPTVHLGKMLRADGYSGPGQRILNTSDTLFDPVIPPTVVRHDAEIAVT
jgi:hypothetical protein